MILSYNNYYYILTVIFSICLSTLATAAYADTARCYDDGYDESTPDSCNSKEPHLLVEFCSGNKETFIRYANHKFTIIIGIHNKLFTVVLFHYSTPKLHSAGYIIPYSRKI